MFIGLSSINRGKITSTNSTHPTSQNAKQIPDQHNAQNKRLIAKRFSAWARNGRLVLPAVEDDSFCFAPIVLSDGGTAAPVPVLSERPIKLDAPISQLIEIVVGDVIIRLDGAISAARVAEIVRAIGSGA